jgi:hypothetical protein
MKGKIAHGETALQGLDKAPAGWSSQIKYVRTPPKPSVGGRPGGGLGVRQVVAMLHRNLSGNFTRSVRRPKPIARGEGPL